MSAKHNKSECLAEFQSLIENGNKEAPLQKFLKAHPDILVDTFDTGSYYPTVFSQFSLAGELIPDFVMIGHRSSWMWTVDLIEIEPSVLNGPLFTKSDLAGKQLRIAEGQLDKWKTWMKEHRDTLFVRKALKKLKERGAWDADPKFYNLSDVTWQMMNVTYRIIIGRRENFQEWGNKYRDLKNAQQHVEIVPWDRLLEKFRDRLNKHSSCHITS